MNHDVTNQVPLFEGRNLFTSDPFLKRIVTTLTENNFAELLTTFGAACGTKERFEAGRLANENPPKLKNFDRFGHRTNEVEYHPSYHELMRFSMANGLHTSPWNSAPTGRLIARCAQNYMMTQVEAGHGCPICMTCSSALEPLVVLERHGSDYFPQNTTQEISLQWKNQPVPWVWR